MIRGLWRRIGNLIGGSGGWAATTLIILFVAGAGGGFLWDEYRQRLRVETSAFESRTEEAARAIDLVTRRLTEHAELLRVALEARLAEPEDGNRVARVLSRLGQSEEFGGWSADSLPPERRAESAHLTGVGRLSDLSDDTRAEIAAAESLTPMMRATTRDLDGFAKVRYLSLSGFAALHPWMSSRFDRFTPEALNENSFIRVTPTFDPDGRTRWVDRRADEPTLSVSAPVNGPNGFRGVIVVEVPARYLLGGPTRDAAGGLDVLLATRDRRVLARGDGRGGPEEAGPSSEVPAGLGASRVVAVAVEIGGRFIVARSLATAPWIVLARTTRGELEAAATRSMRHPLVAVPTAIVLLGFMLRLARVNRRLSAGERELRAMTADLIRARDEARAADRAKAVFLANIGHELRTPLNAVIGFAELIPSLGADSKESRALDEYAAYIKDAGDHLLNVLNDVLDLARAEADRIEVRETPVDPAELVTRCGRMVGRQAETDGVTLSHRSENGTPNVLADEVRLRQIVINLLTNAVKFTPKGGRVETEVIRNAEGGVRLVVRDTGVGIAAADIPKALEPFGQVHNALSRTRRGAGLGLALSRRLVELHGGRLTIESEPGVGTTVVVDLPASRVVPQAGKPESADVNGIGTAPAPAD